MLTTEAAQKRPHTEPMLTDKPAGLWPLQLIRDGRPLAAPAFTKRDE